MASYPRILQRTLGVLFWAVVVLLVLAVAAAVYFAVWGGADINLAVPVSFVPDATTVRLTSPTFGDGVIVQAQGMASFDETGGTWHTVRAAMLALLLIVPSLVSLRLLHRLVGTVADGRPFQASSVNMIRTIGGLVIVSEVLWASSTYLLERSVAAEVVASGVMLGSNLTLNVPIVLLGLVIIAIAEVFRYGIVLQSDVDLTV
jgi:hypothetical protein